MSARWPLTLALASLEDEIWSTTPFAAVGLMVPSADDVVSFEFHPPVVSSAHPRWRARPARRIRSAVGDRAARGAARLGIRDDRLRRSLSGSPARVERPERVAGAGGGRQSVSARDDRRMGFRGAPRFERRSG